MAEPFVMVLPAARKPARSFGVEPGGSPPQHHQPNINHLVLKAHIMDSGAPFPVIDHPHTRQRADNLTQHGGAILACRINAGDPQPGQGVRPGGDRQVVMCVQMQAERISVRLVSDQRQEYQGYA